MHRNISGISPRSSLRVVSLLGLTATMAFAMACAGDSPTAPSATSGVPAGAGLTPTSVSDDETGSTTLDTMKKVTTSCSAPDFDQLPVIDSVRPDPLSTAKSGGRLKITGANFQNLVEVTTVGPIALGAVVTVNRKGTQITQNYQVTTPGATGSLDLTVETLCGRTTVQVI